MAKDCKHYINFNFFATKDTLRKLNIGLGNEIIFIGFPSFFYNERNISPIARTGIIASDPLEDYYFSTIYRQAIYHKYKALLPEKITGFLIDANVIGGSSGSLVLLRPENMNATRTGNLIKYQGHLLILGIVTYSYEEINKELKINVG